MEDNNLPSRKLLFISHANPADNNFTIWLGSRLSAMGFEVWADLQDLKYGSKHWRIIEDKIRNEAIKVLVVTSFSSRNAEGVENEIYIAKGIEKELNLSDFIIQLKIDNLPYSQLPPALNNRLAISFKNNWRDGLTKLVKQFDEENVPRKEEASSAVNMFSEVLKDKSDKIVDIEEPSFLSWLPVNYPDKIEVYTFPGSSKTMSDSMVSLGIPAFSFSNTMITFALPETVSYSTKVPTDNLQYAQSTTENWINELSLSEFAIQRSDRRRAFNGLLNISWELMLQKRGLIEYQLSNEAAYFFPTENGLKIKQQYSDPMGRLTGPVTLVGKSAKYSALWHAAISAKSFLYPIPAYSVRLHVAFTDDGLKSVASGEKAFRMRRSFCKNFWNDRWRRLLFAFFSKLSDEQDQIIVETGGDESILVDYPISLATPYSIESDLAINSIENVEEEIEINDEEFNEYDEAWETDLTE